MSYETFKEIFMKELRKANPELQLEFKTLNKTNKTVEGICIANTEISPVIYCEDMYVIFIRMGSIAAAVVEASEMLKSEPPTLTVPEIDVNKIRPYLMNYEKNKERLSGIPHRRMLDLVLVYRQVVVEDENGLGSFLLTNKMIEDAGLSEPMLFGFIAKKHEPFFVRSLSEFTGMPGDVPLMIVTNEKILNGAVCMLYEDVLSEVAEKAGGNFYIIPSSIHEILVIGEKDLPDNEFLKMLIPEANSTVVSETEVLSNSLYYYDVALNGITIVK